MRSILRNLLVSSLALAFPLAGGCSNQTDTNASGESTTDIFPGDPDPGFSSGVTGGGFGGFGDGGGPSLPFGFWSKRFGDAADQKAGALAINAAEDIAITGSARGTIDFGNVPWTGSTT